MIKKKSLLATEIARLRSFSKLPFFAEKKKHTHILILAGIVLILMGLALSARCFVIEQLEHRHMAHKSYMRNNLSKYSPADVVDTIQYFDENGVRSGTISVLDTGNKTATCGFGINNPCLIYWNVAAKAGDTQLTPYLLLARGFGDSTYKSMKYIDAATFEIKTEGGIGDCNMISTYLVKISGTSGWIITKDVETECYNSKGVVYSTDRYSTTTIESGL